MCHEASGRALQAALGTGKGTADIDDWDAAELIIVMGVNAASNAPRMLTALAEAHRRGAQIVHVNPLKEAASRRTIVPHEFGSMATFHPTPTGTLDIQPRIGGDLALLGGVAKALFEWHCRGPHRDRHLVHRRQHPRLRRLPSLLRSGLLVRDRPPIRRHRGRDSKPGRPLPEIPSARSSAGAWG